MGYKKYMFTSESSSGSLLDSLRLPFERLLPELLTGWWLSDWRQKERVEERDSKFKLLGTEIQLRF